jgi:drug/metabolite transporter, DME family
MAEPRPAPAHPINPLGIVAILAAAACWGLSGIFVKLIMAEGPVSPLSLAFWRDAFAFVTFFLIALIFERDRMRLPRSAWPWIASMGVALGGFHVVLNMGYQLNGAAITTIQQAAMPAIVLIAARIIWKEPLTRLKMVSLLLIAVGTFLVSGLLHATAPEVTAGGIIVGLCVPLSYAGWSLLGKKLRSDCSAVVTLTWAFGIAAMVLLPFQIIAGTLLPPPLPMRAFMYFGGLIGISTVAAFFTYLFALGRLPAGIATILVMSEIAFAVLYARIFLAEVLSPLEIGGALLVVLGTVILVNPRKTRPIIYPPSTSSVLQKPPVVSDKL